MNKDLVAIFEYLEREKKIDRKIIIQAIEESLIIAARKSIKGVGEVHVSVNSKSGEIETYVEKEVMDKVEYPEEEILLEHARELNPKAQLGDILEVAVSPENFGRIAAQTAKQVIAQKLRGAERDVIYEEYRHRINEIVSGTIKRVVHSGTLIVDLGKVEAILPDRFYPQTEKYHVGERIQALLLEVRDTHNGGAEVILSRSHPEIVKQLFIQEVPELSDGVITIEKIAREAGYRTKLSVSSQDSKVDPLGSCVGVRGTRVKNIIRELNNEKIDIVIDTKDPVQLLQNLLDPIEIRKIMVDEEAQVISIVVDDEAYPIVIGKRGMNARLNAQMIGHELKVKKMTHYQKELNFEQGTLAQADNPALDEELKIEGVNQFILDSIKESGFDTPRKILNVNAEELSKEVGISREMTDDILDKLRNKRT